MADYLRAALDTDTTSAHRVVLFLDSTGGQVEEGDRGIHVLDEIKPTHRLVTAVLNGKLCASMYIPIFLQGDDRLAARTSSWIFHEAAKRGSERQGAPRGDVAPLAYILRPRRGLDPLDQQRRTYHQTSRPLATRGRSRRGQDRHCHISAGEMDRAARPLQHLDKST
jgi:hypothetical protein